MKSFKQVLLSVSCLFLFCFSGFVTAQNLTISSPDERISVELDLDSQISWKVSLDNVKVIEKAIISMDMGNGRVLGAKPKLKNKKMENLNKKMTVQIPNKDAVIDNKYNQLTMDFKDNYQLIVKVFNEGMAYCFKDQSDKTTAVFNEGMSLTFPEKTMTYFPKEESMYSHNERQYLVKAITEIPDGDFCSLPVLFETPKAKVLFTEASLHNYPGMFLAADDGKAFSAKFSKYVLKAVPNEKSGPDRNQIIEEEAEYIAKVDGERGYPWRVFIICDDDRTLVESNLVTQLSGSSKIPDADWIKPGKVAWDWYNYNNIYGVDFEAGLNMATYKYFVDFASKNGIEYVILDEGWTKSTTEILDDNEELDVPELIKYAKSKNVDIILWVLWKPLNEAPEKILQLYSSWGAVGVKVDFMQRSDQYMVASYEKIAEIAAKYRLMVDYHGAFKPAGIERVWPNLINYEGLLGNEQNKWSKLITPEHNVTLPFIRMVAGPMDFTPGSMFNTSEQNYAISFTRPMSMGTRAHQVAMYVVFEAPLQMMCESPTVYYKEQETVDFITQIPTVWEETHVLEASVANYIVIARRNGNDWYIGAMTDWDARDFDLDLSFLGDGVYQMQSLADGINASRHAQDYKIENKTVDKSSKIKINLSKGGGFSAILKKVPSKDETGFKTLFNGKNLDGWVGNKQSYKVENGTIVVDPKGGGSGGNLFTSDEYSDFNFRFEFQLTPGANNGLGIHAPLKGDAAYEGKEIQILDNTASKYESLKAYQYHGSVYGLIPAKRGFLKPIGEWNEEEVIVKGSRIKVILNGATIVDSDFLEASKNGTIDGKDHPGLQSSKGHIGFLGHGDVLRFRNIRIKDLSGQ